MFPKNSFTLNTYDEDGSVIKDKGNKECDESLDTDNQINSIQAIDTNDNLTNFEKVVLLNLKRTEGSVSEIFSDPDKLFEQYNVKVTGVDKFKSCHICALPRKILEILETELFLHQISFDEAVSRYSITISDIKTHINTCILERKVAIPAGSLLNSLILEIHEFIERMPMFRYKLDSSMDNETIITYLATLTELRTAIKEVSKLDSPEDDAILIIKHVFNPLITSYVRELALKIDEFKVQLKPFLKDKSDFAIQELLKSFVKDLAFAYNQKLINSLVKYSELTGIKPEVILGNDYDKKL